MFFSGFYTIQLIYTKFGIDILRHSRRITVGFNTPNQLSFQWCYFIEFLLIPRSTYRTKFYMNNENKSWYKAPLTLTSYTLLKILYEYVYICMYVSFTLATISIYLSAQNFDLIIKIVGHNIHEQQGNYLKTSC